MYPADLVKDNLLIRRFNHIKQLLYNVEAVNFLSNVNLEMFNKHWVL
ncbi:hypothetical protein M3699_25415 [Peribacillus simplex]|nr:hypothetical protein [Peribacillus simplex]MCM3677066.1 hypothetical protein [Peribacillus simplex]